MFEIAMPVIVYRELKEIGSGQLLPNGASLALCPDESIELVVLEANSEAVEERMPMTFFEDDRLIAEGELFHSGDYICLCPNDISIDLINPENSAELYLDDFGRSAKLCIRSAA